VTLAVQVAVHVSAGGRRRAAACSTGARRLALFAPRSRPHARVAQRLNRSARRWVGPMSTKETAATSSATQAARDATRVRDARWRRTRRRRRDQIRRRGPPRLACAHRALEQDGRASAIGSSEAVCDMAARAGGMRGGGGLIGNGRDRAAREVADRRRWRTAARGPRAASRPCRASWPTRPRSSTRRCCSSAAGRATVADVAGAGVDGAAGGHPEAAQRAVARAHADRRRGVVPRGAHPRAAHAGRAGAGAVCRPPPRRCAKRSPTKCCRNPRLMALGSGLTAVVGFGMWAALAAQQARRSRPFRSGATRVLSIARFRRLGRAGSGREVLPSPRSSSFSMRTIDAGRRSSVRRTGRRRNTTTSRLSISRSPPRTT
jgi:hypothetical protein